MGGHQSIVEIEGFGYSEEEARISLGCALLAKFHVRLEYNRGMKRWGIFQQQKFYPVWFNRFLDAGKGEYIYRAFIEVK